MRKTHTLTLILLDYECSDWDRQLTYSNLYLLLLNLTARQLSVILPFIYYYLLIAFLSCPPPWARWVITEEIVKNNNNIEFQLTS